jgi:Tfp pilus assembly protein PilX
MKNRFHKKASALVTTLFVVVVLSTIVMAFMASMSLERKISKSLSNRYQADLAAEAGFAYASGFLARLATNDHFIIYANTNGQLFLGSGANQTAGAFSYTPLFSTTTSITANATSIVTNGIPSTNITGTTFTNTLPGGLTVTSPQITWIPLTNGANQTYARFAFWVEDLGGRVDLSVAGTNHTSTNANRPTGTNAAELAVWSFFNTSATNAVSTAANNLATKRGVLLTPATIRLAENSVTTNQLSEFAVRLRHDTNEPEVIPYGFGYTSAGQPKADLNSFVATGNVMGLAGVININLPQFGSLRRGGLADTVGNYTATIAASAIDYADSNSTPSVQTTTPRYRGVDSTPFTTILYNKYDWYSRGGGTISIRLSTFAQLWNMSNQTINGTFTINQTNQDEITDLGWSRHVAVSLHGPDSRSTNISILPNQIRVVGFTEDLTNIPTGAFSLNASQKSLPMGANDNYNFTATWNGQIIDTLQTGAQRVSRTLWEQPQTTASKRPEWAGFLPGLRYGDGSDTNLSNRTSGDPRSTFYITSRLFNQNYDTRTAWGGMAVMRPEPPNSPVGEARYLTRPWLWSDPVTNSATFTPGLGSFTTLDERQPPDASNLGALTNGTFPGSTNHAPQRISNSGNYTQITELGNIYDPAQWRYPGYPSNSIPANGATADSAFGGGFSLRIGRPEHPLFTNDGRRAAQLLDILAAGPTIGNGTVINPVAGRININTASTNALRALAAGVFHTKDPILATSTTVGTNFVPPAAAIAAFVNGVLTNRIHRRPFFSTSDLSMLATDTNTASWPSSAVFGNPTLLGATLWNDAAAEEWFAKILPLSTVRSRNFLIHVVSQTMTTNTPPTILAEQRRIYQIYLQPLRSPAGLTTNSAPITINAWGL